MGNAAAKMLRRKSNESRTEESGKGKMSTQIFSRPLEVKA